MPVTAVPQFERFFRATSSLDVDKSDVKRCRDFIYQNIYDLLVIAAATAKTNGRDIIEPADLPITKGLQESIHKFRRLDQDIELLPVLDELTDYPQLELGLSGETIEQLPMIAGGLTLALSCTFPIIDPDVKNPQTEQWERAFRLFDLLL